MPYEGSVSPKERVNIVYRPATGDVQEEVELPLKLMVVGDFTLRKDDRMLENREAISVDKDNFDKVMQSQGLSLQMQVPDKLSGTPDAMLSADLKFNTLKDFGPDALVEMVPELAKLMQLREALKALKGPLSNIPNFRKKLQDLVNDEKTREALLQELGIDGEQEK
ncbi:type VI secretion system contractile sheath small subunit [Cloacibacillus porcorum]|uniref:type VI secretion system contractile sheath small subunit n=1 Tax=Cloacibacillus porcorum TaxID=1197717 RepID=UPI0026721011|nr:type VI secretion system contractile sheath small subunit [Cloacibacillus porcorum]